VYISVIGSDSQKRLALSLLQKERKRFQSMIAKNVILKYTPKLKFFADDSIDRGNRILKILNELEQEPPQTPEE
jgi:ribosome-binding factor A